MTAQQVAVKKYVVKLSADEREQLNTLILYRKTPCPSADEGAYPVEGRCLRGR